LLKALLLQKIGFAPVLYFARRVQRNLPLKPTRSAEILASPHEVPITETLGKLIHMPSLTLTCAIDTVAERFRFAHVLESRYGMQRKCPLKMTLSVEIFAST